MNNSLSFLRLPHTQVAYRLALLWTTRTYAVCAFAACYAVRRHAWRSVLHACTRALPRFRARAAHRLCLRSLFSSLSRLPALCALHAAHALPSCHRPPHGWFRTRTRSSADTPDPRTHTQHTRIGARIVYSAARTPRLRDATQHCTAPHAGAAHALRRHSYATCCRAYARTLRRGADSSSPSPYRRARAALLYGSVHCVRVRYGCLTTALYPAARHLVHTHLPRCIHTASTPSTLLFAMQHRDCARTPPHARARRSERSVACAITSCLHIRETITRSPYGRESLCHGIAPVARAHACRMGRYAAHVCTRAHIVASP